MAMPPLTPQQHIEAACHRAREAVTAGLAKHAHLLTADPKGLDAVCHAAMLRFYADLIERGFGEGNEIGPLKLTVDEVKARLLRAVQGAL